MKYLKKKKKKRSGVIIGLILVLLATVAAIVLFLNHAKGDSSQIEFSGEAEQVTSTAATSEAAIVPVENAVLESNVGRDYRVVELLDGQIQTPYCTLSYPEGLEDLLHVINTSQQPYTLEFYAVMEGKQELRLFDLSLGENSGGNMGVVATEAGEIPLNVTIYTLTMNENWSDGEIITAYAMQDAINEIIEQLAPKTKGNEPAAPVINQQPEETGTIHNLEIETPYCTLYYPARWAGTVSYISDDTQEDVYKVHFYSRMNGLENQLLFSIYFGGDEGDQLGAVMNSEKIPVPVNLIVNQLQVDGLNDADAQLLYTMQEASNQLIERLPLLK